MPACLGVQMTRYARLVHDVNTVVLYHQLRLARPLARTRRNPMTESLRLSARVRLRRSIVPGVPELCDEGIVARLDARGVVVRLDSGREVMTEPDMLVVLEGSDERKP